MKLYLFNPDADMALANNEENYMAPNTIRQMGHDLAMLPLWYASSGSGLLASSAYNADYLKQMEQLFPLQVQLITEPELPECKDVRVLPWGWNRALRKRLLRAGIDEWALPSPEQLAAYRQLASRASSLTLLHTFHSFSSEYICGDRRLISEVGQLSASATEMLLHGCLFKLLWSSSGRGLFWCREGLTKPAHDWCCRALRLQGGVMVEPIYERVDDFAMEFYSDGNGSVSFAGYSHFITNSKGGYEGNLLAPDKQIEAKLNQYVPLEVIEAIRLHLVEALGAIYGGAYTGFLGVDMMVCQVEGSSRYAIHPHVEVNMRMNMGVVSRTIYDHFVVEGGKGTFRIEHFPANETLQLQHAHDLRHDPLVVRNGRVLSGYLPLVPVTPRSCYRAYIKIDS